MQAGLPSAFYVERYLSFSLPAILTGLIAPIAGLPPTVDVHGGSGDCAGALFAARTLRSD